MSRSKRPHGEHEAADEIGLPEPIVDSFSPAIVLMYLNSLLEARRRGTLDNAAFEQEVRKLLFHDADGRLWAPGARSMKWYRRDGEQWIEQSPPEALFDRPGFSLLGHLRAPRSSPPVATPAHAVAVPAAPPAPPAAPRQSAPPPAATPTPAAQAPARRGMEISRSAFLGLAATLRQALTAATPDERAALRRTFVAHDAAGTEWTANPDTGILARRTGGAWVEVAADDGPMSVRIDERAVEAIRRLARVAPAIPVATAPAARPAAAPPAGSPAPGGAATDKCQHCGQPMGPGKKFCAACGRSAKPHAAPPAATESPEARVCKTCGTSVAARARFCPACGKTL